LPPPLIVSGLSPERVPASVELPVTLSVDSLAMKMGRDEKKPSARFSVPKMATAPGLPIGVRLGRVVAGDPGGKWREAGPAFEIVERDGIVIVELGAGIESRRTADRFRHKLVFV
jgi:hypothetical protein